MQHAVHMLDIFTSSTRISRNKYIKFPIPHFVLTFAFPEELAEHRSTAKKDERSNKFIKERKRRMLLKRGMGNGEWGMRNNGQR